jgi:ribosomal protein L11 methylase PrmA
MTKKDLSGIIRDGMQNEEEPVVKPLGTRRTRTTPQKDEPINEVEEQLTSLKLELEKEQAQVKHLLKELQEQKELSKTLSQELEEEQEKVKSLQKQEPKKFIVPVGMGNHLVITPATSTVLTNEEIGWFD